MLKVPMMYDPESARFIEFNNQLPAGKKILD